jgi:hypothetical protein
MWLLPAIGDTCSTRPLPLAFIPARAQTYSVRYWRALSKNWIPAGAGMTSALHILNNTITCCRTGFYWLALGLLTSTGPAWRRHSSMSRRDASDGFSMPTIIIPSEIAGS